MRPNNFMWVSFNGFLANGFHLIFATGWLGMTTITVVTVIMYPFIKLIDISEFLEQRTNNDSRTQAGARHNLGFSVLQKSLCSYFISVT